MSQPTPRDTLATALQAVAELARVDWDEVEATELPGLADSLAKVKTLAEGALVSVAGRLEETDAAAAHGWASAKDFLTHLLGGHKGAGGTFVRAATQTRDLPDVRKALADGEVSVTQAKVIGQHVASLPRDPELRQKAAGLLLGRVREQGMDATDLDHAFPDVAKELDPDGTLLADEANKPKAERGAHNARFLSFTRDNIGGVRIRGYASREEAEIVKATLMPLAAPVTTEPGACGGDPDRWDGPRDEQGLPVNPGCPDPACAHDGKDPRDSGARMWDALVEACIRLQGSEQLPQSHGTSARILVTINEKDLRDELRGRGLLPDGETLSATAVRRLACNAEIIPGVLSAKGEILDLGRAQRLVTAALFLALILRDQHCCFPGCNRPAIACDAHHIKHWADGGETSLDNLVLLCRRHHTITHHTPWTVHIDPETKRPVWTPPPRGEGQFSYHPPTPREQRHPLVA